jgi:hypothetical protein
MLQRQAAQVGVLLAEELGNQIRGDLNVGVRHGSGRSAARRTRVPAGECQIRRLTEYGVPEVQAPPSS